MVQSLVRQLSLKYREGIDYLPPGLLLCLFAAYLGDGRYLNVYRGEFIGSILMVVLTFSAGKWIGENDVFIAWSCHALGVILADLVGGGYQVNPAMTVAMWALGKVDGGYTEVFVRIAGQMAGGLVSFPLCHYISETFDLTPFGGPEFKAESEEPVEAALSEFFSTFLLCWAIYILNFEFHFGKFHYWVKMLGTAAAIRALIEFFPTAGPAMNPMLATAWDVFGVGNSYAFPDESQHYFVYWVLPCAAALLASFTYVVYAGGLYFGKRLPIGPIKPSSSTASSASSKATTGKKKTKSKKN